jgi:hypothetical protein
MHQFCRQTRGSRQPSEGRFSEGIPWFKIPIHHLSVFCGVVSHLYHLCLAIYYIFGMIIFETPMTVLGWLETRKKKQIYEFSGGLKDLPCSKSFRKNRWISDQH